MAVDATRAPDTHADEALLQASGMTLTVVLEHVLSVSGHDAVTRTLGRAGLSGRESEIRDERSWWSWRDKQALFSAAAEELNDPHVTEHAAARSLEANVGAGLKVALRTLGSPQMVYANLARANHKFSRNSRMETEALGDGHARVRFWHEVDVRPTRLDCGFNVGLLACPPRLFGLGPARVLHTACIVDGAPECVYEMRWDPRGHGGRTARSLTAAGVAAAGLGAALGAGSVPVEAGVGAVAVGLLGCGFDALQRVLRRGRRLEQELAWRVWSADALRDSLHALAAELDRDSLLDLVVTRACDGSAAESAALLLDDGSGTLVVSASRRLDAAQGACLQRWADDAPRVLDVVQDVDDVAAVPQLAALARPDAAHPVASLCAVPIQGRSGVRGLLVALARRAETFMPQDRDWLEAYSQQAAIALSNAALYAVQHHMAQRDPLTGLRNHREFHAALEGQIARCRRENDQAGFTLVLVDLDCFKAVNDASGHAAGDALLRRVAAAIEDAGRAEDRAFRVGGDEFAVLLPALSEPDAAAVASRVCTQVGACDPRIGASVGLAGFPADATDKDELLALADGRLYAMKAAARSDRPRSATVAVVPGG